MKQFDIFGNDITEQVIQEEKKRKNSERANKAAETRKKKPFLIRCSPLQEVNVICLVTNTPKRKEMKLRNTLGKILKREIRNDSTIRVFT